MDSNKNPRQPKQSSTSASKPEQNRKEQTKPGRQRTVQQVKRALLTKAEQEEYMCEQARRVDLLNKELRYKRNPVEILLARARIGLPAPRRR